MKRKRVIKTSTSYGRQMDESQTPSAKRESVSRHISCKGIKGKTFSLGSVWAPPSWPSLTRTTLIGWRVGMAGRSSYGKAGRNAFIRMFRLCVIRIFVRL